MPYRQTYFEAPKNMNAPVAPDLPEAYREEVYPFGPKTAYLKREYWGQNRDYSTYFCYHCCGWILGEPNVYPVNTLDTTRLAGRQGHEYYCRRCGKQIAFDGVMS